MHKWMKFLWRNYVGLWKIGSICRPLPSVWHDSLYNQVEFRPQDIWEIYLLFQALQHLVVLFYFNFATLVSRYCSDLLQGFVVRIISRSNCADHRHHSNRNCFIFLFGPVCNFSLDYSTLPTIANGRASRATSRKTFRWQIHCATSKLTHDTICLRFDSHSHCGIIFLILYMFFMFSKY